MLTSVIGALRLRRRCQRSCAPRLQRSPTSISRIVVIHHQRCWQWQRRQPHQRCRDQQPLREHQGCVDHHSRMYLSDGSCRYLVPRPLPPAGTPILHQLDPHIPLRTRAQARPASRRWDSTFSDAQFPPRQRRRELRHRRPAESLTRWDQSDHPPRRYQARSCESPRLAPVSYLITTCPQFGKAPAKFVEFDVYSRHGHIVVFVPRSFSGVLELHTRRGRILTMPSLSTAAQTVKNARNEVVLLVGQGSQSPMGMGGVTPQFADLGKFYTRSGDISVGFTGEDDGHALQPQGFVQQVLKRIAG
ncbi:hypothetical protein BV25DRAFT_922324 [Artomyces pyxidatus]|uniref:Uncharacterized protein n=1 Tax=Artomyces pyxidatus TaxID=48021 RepID=A0ACB8SW38_9AGAM|nr:hypothetical protein BV25DRAFT_922324 [Artomyces pyxidatus]